MTFKFEQPPAKLTWYYLGPLLDADAGTLKYDKDQYRVSGVSNNATACVWADLLAPDDEGLVLTDLGRTMLAEWKATPEGLKYERERSMTDDELTRETDRALEQWLAERPGQLDLFGGAL